MYVSTFISSSNHSMYRAVWMKVQFLFSIVRHIMCQDKIWTTTGARFGYQLAYMVVHESKKEADPKEEGKESRKQQESKWKLLLVSLLSNTKLVKLDECGIKVVLFNQL